jgi:hypothetical protein
MAAMDADAHADMAYRCLCTCGVRSHLACLQAVHSPTALCCCFCPVLQRFRFTTSVMYTVCVSCEFLTPRFPSHFLLLTAVSNVGRAVGLTTFVSTQPAFQQALCASGNMADLASKTQVRVACVDAVHTIYARWSSMLILEKSVLGGVFGDTVVHLRLLRQNNLLLSRRITVHFFRCAAWRPWLYGRACAHHWSVHRGQVMGRTCIVACATCV